MPLRLLLFFAVASVTLMANEQKQFPNCCEPESEKLSQAKVKALVKQTFNGVLENRKNRALG